MRVDFSLNQAKLYCCFKDCFCKLLHILREIVIMLITCVSSQEDNNKYSSHVEVTKPQSSLDSSPLTSSEDSVLFKSELAKSDGVDNNNEIVIGINEKRTQEPLTKTIPGNSKPHSDVKDKFTSLFDTLSTSKETNSDRVTQNVISEENSLVHKRASGEKLTSSEEEERELVLTSVKHVDCRDFPFDEVLSLEETVNKKANCISTKKMRQYDSSVVSSVVHQEIFGELDNFQFGIRAKNTALESSKEILPPLLNCSTWPTNEKSDQGLEDSRNTYTRSACSRNLVSDLDSPSFYSASAIDFSAISHLSEEHDKMLAKENAEKSKTTNISNATKARICGIAAQRNLSANGKSHHESSKHKKAKESTCTISSVAFNGGMSPQLNVATAVKQPIIQSVTKSEIVSKKTSNGEGLSKKTPKSAISPLEKAFRKRYSSTSGITVSSSPFPSLQNINNLAPFLEPLSTDENKGTGEIVDGSKKNMYNTMEKHPLPPEGFKISRYPLSRKSSNQHSKDAVDQNTTENTELHRIISELKEKLHRAEEQIVRVEEEAKRWKQSAKESLLAIQTAQRQLDSKKVQIHSGEVVIKNKEEGFNKRTIPRRWSNEEISSKKDILDEARSRIVSADDISSFQAENIKTGQLEPSNLKRASPYLTSKNHTKRLKLSEADAMNDRETSTKNMLYSLDNSESNVEDFMSFIQSLDVSMAKSHTSFGNACQEVKTPVNEGHSIERANSPIHTPSLARNQLQSTTEKVGDCEIFLSDEMEKRIPQKQPLKVQNSLDKFLETFSYEGEANCMTVLHENEQRSQSPLFDSFHSFSPETSLSDSELLLKATRRNAGEQAKVHLTQRQSNSEKDLTKLDFLEWNNHQIDFLDQLDCILDL